MNKEQFESHVEKVPEAGCWIWMQTLLHNGYGRSCHAGKRILAHRLSYTLYKGHIPNGACILHRCDIRCCVNPEHLYLGNHSDNIRDMLDRKGTSHYFNSEATHCKWGHEFTKENTYTWNGGRACKMCHAERSRQWRANKKKS